ncbi:MAG: PKD domain-containing protein, partial [Thermoplasmata archaeon]|nr:PKD domain-containing protein [Thermoplasmata archaeon]
GDGGWARIKKLESRSVPVGENITFEAAGGEEIHYMWNFGDGSDIGIGKQVTHNYSSIDTYAVTLTCYNRSTGEYSNDTVDIKVTGIMSGEPILMQFIVMVICLGPFFLTSLSLLLFAFVSKKILNVTTKRKWEVKKLFIFWLLLMCLFLYFMLSLLFFLMSANPGVFMITLLSVGGGVTMWAFSGLLSIAFLPLVVRLLRVLPLGIGKGLCIIRKPPPIERKVVNGKEAFSKKNLMDFALETSIGPLFLTFFIMSLASYNITDPHQFWSVGTILLIFMAPILTFIVVPIQILYDSNIVWVRRSKGNGAEVRYLGSTVSEIFRELMGVGALGAFIGVFINLGSGAELEQFFWAVLMILAIVPMVFPNVFMVVLIYGFVHNFMVRRVNRRFMRMGFEEYVIKVHRKDEKHIAVVPSSMKGGKLERLEKDLN